MGDTLHHRVWCQKREVTRTREYIHTHACSRVEQRAESNLQAADKHVACVSHVTGQSVTSHCHSRLVCQRPAIATRVYQTEWAMRQTPLLLPLLPLPLPILR